MNAEARTREALEWALQETVLRIPPSLVDLDEWKWDDDDKSFRAPAVDGEFRFHVAAERRRDGLHRIAVLVVEDDDGCKATWEARMPAADPRQEG